MYSILRREYKKMKHIKDGGLKSLDYPCYADIADTFFVVDTFISVIKKETDKNTIPLLIGTGTSGLYLMAIISSKIDCNILYIRKNPSETNHGSKLEVPTYVENISYTAFIIDDCIASGGTMNYIFSEMHNGVKNDARLKSNLRKIKAIIVTGLVGESRVQNIEDYALNNYLEIEKIYSA